MAENILTDALGLKKLKEGDAFKSIFVVVSISPKIDKNGRTYYDMAVSDASGSFEAKVWSDAQWLDKSGAAAADDEHIDAEKIPTLCGRTVGVNGKVSGYRGQMQYSFAKITLLNQEKFPPVQYMQHSPIGIDKLTARLNALIDSCGGEVGAFVKKVFTGEFITRFSYWPAAVGHHHAYANGLLEHTVSVAASARSMAQSMRESGYEIDVDVVTVGALLHDIGKLEAYKMESAPEMTTEGAFIDHVALGFALFGELAAKHGLSRKLALHLQHIILSHHGQREYGSPVVPATPEALIVSAADELDFHIFCWSDSVKNLHDTQEISPWSASAQRRFWKV